MKKWLPKGRKRRHRSDRRRLRIFETLETRHLLAADPFGTNSLQPLDVSRDGLVSSLDALNVINAIGRSESGAATPEDSPGLFIDVSGDGLGTALDALQIINAIGRQQPIIAATLPNDSAYQDEFELQFDLLTNDYSLDLHLSLTDSDTPSVSIRVNGESNTPFTNISEWFTDGRASLSESQLDAIAGQPLIDGQNRFEVKAANSSISFSVFIDRSIASTSPLSLTETSDTGTLGDNITSAARVTLSGETERDAIVSLPNSDVEVLVADSGIYRFSEQELEVGENLFEVRLADLAGNQRTESYVIEREISTQNQNIVTSWNQITLESIELDATPAPEATRTLTMVHTAIFDVVNAIDQSPPLYVLTQPQSSVSMEAAVTSAASEVLLYAFPTQHDRIASHRDQVLDSINDIQLRDAGIQLGRSIGQAIIELRSDDGWDEFNSYSGNVGAGSWRPTPPMFSIPVLPHWATVDPWVIETPNQFRPAGPPDLASEQYALAYQEVISVGQAGSQSRQADQTEAALFWLDGSGTYTPAGHWNQIASNAVESIDASISESARVLAQLNLAMADAIIAAWDAKYHYKFWRPETASGGLEDDLNTETSAVENWRPLLNSPNHPEYVSGHSSVGGAADAVLTRYFGDEFSFESESIGLPGVRRSFSNFREASNEAGKSRVFGGIHFEFSNADGLQLGRQIGNQVLKRFVDNEDIDPPKIVVSPNPGLLGQDVVATSSNLTVTGQVFDNITGVETLTVQLDQSEPLALSIDDMGGFQWTTPLATDGSEDGPHTIALTATDRRGNRSAPELIEFLLDTRTPTVDLNLDLNNGPIERDFELLGTVDGTGSAVTRYTYSIDNAEIRPIGFDSTGQFQQPLPLQSLLPGRHTISIHASDAAGNLVESNHSFEVGAFQPPQITDLTPAPGGNEVGVTFKPQIYFSRPVDPKTLTQANFYATDSSGRRLPTTIVPAQDGSFSWLYFTDPMPGGSTITVHLLGDTILGAIDRAALDADTDGRPGGNFRYSFTTVNTAPNPTTSISGFVLDPGPDLKPFTNDDIRRGPDSQKFTEDDLHLRPIAGVQIFVIGNATNTVTTDANGYFELQGVPLGNLKLVVDGRTATNPPENIFFPEMVMSLDAKAGVANSAMARIDVDEVYLPRIQQDVLETVKETGTTQITLSAESAEGLTEEERQLLSLEVPADSLLDELGNPIEGGRVGISTVPPELVTDMLPPGLMQHTFDITIQAFNPDGSLVSNFATPAPMTFPNVFRASPGEQLAFLSFDHTTGQLVIEGTATVAADGLSVSTDPGTGITKPGWHGLAPPGTPAVPPVPLDQRPDERPEKPEEEECFDLPDAIETVLDLTTKAANCAAGFTGLRAGLAEIFRLAQSIQSLIGNVSNAIRAAENGATQSQISSSLNAILDSKKILESSINILKAQNPLGKALAIANCLEQLLAAAEGICDKVQKNNDLPSPCKTPASDATCKGISFAKTKLGIANSIANQAEEGLAKLSLALLCAKIETLASLLGLTADSPEGEAEGEEEPVSQEILETLREIQQEAEVVAVDIDAPNRWGQDFQAGVERSAELVTDAAQWHWEVFGLPGNTYYHVSIANGIEIRGTTDPEGRFEVFLPTETEYTLAIYDPNRNRIGRVTGVTAAQINGFPIAPFVFPIVPMVSPDLTDDTTGERFFPDRDNDGLVDLAENIIGTRIDSVDTDGDGISDFHEVTQGRDPLDVTLLPLGVLGQTPLAGGAVSIDVAPLRSFRGERLAYLATGASSMAIVDVTEVTNPILKSEMSIDGSSTAIAVDRESAMGVLAGSAGIHLVDISNPDNPQLEKKLPNGTDSRAVRPAAHSVEIKDGLAYVVGSNYVSVVDLLTNQLIETLDIEGAPVVDASTEADYLYTITNTGKLSIIDISETPLRTVKIFETEFSLPGEQPTATTSVFVANKIAYIGNQNLVGCVEPFATVDVSDPNNPTILAQSLDSPIAGQSIVPIGSGLGVTAGSPRNAPVLDLVNLTDPTNAGTFLSRVEINPTRINCSPFQHEVVVSEGIAFFTMAGIGLQVINYRQRDIHGQPPVVQISTDANDQDPLKNGFQSYEGTRARIEVNTFDDVQVSTAELIVDGITVASATQFPYEFVATLPQITAMNTSSIVQVRATDTGGNTALSNALVFELIEDEIAPQVITTQPAIGSDVFFTPAIEITFDKSINEQTLTEEAISITRTSSTNETGGQEETTIPIQELNFIRRGTILRMVPEGVLTTGTYNVTLDRSAIVDLAGNQIEENIDFSFNILPASEVIATSGTPRTVNAPSANPGQVIPLPLANTTSDTTVTFNVRDAFGNPSTRDVAPLAIDLEQGVGYYSVPEDADTGDITLPGDQPIQVPLQIVPLIESLDISFTNFTTGVATTLLYGKGFIEGDAVYQFGGEQVSDSEDNQGPDVLGNNQSVRLSVPTTGPVTGPITVTTAGGTSDPFSVRFDDIISVATSGTPANPSEPSANPGQVITVTGTQLTELTDFMTRFRDPSGGIRYEIIQPNFASADGTQATLLIPEKYNGAFNIRRLGADQEHLLQIVPVVESIDVTSFNGTATLTGKGFQEAAGAIYQISGINIVDDSVSQSPHVNFNNQTANLTLPMHGFGQFTLTTDGGISEPISPNFFHPALGELRDIAFDGNHVWVADTAGKIHQVDRSSGQTLSTVDLPGGTASGIGLHITPEAMTLAGITVPAGSLLVSNSRPSPDQVFAINPITGEIISTLALEQNLDVVSLTYDPSGGGHLYLLDANPSQVVEIDLGTGSVINTIDISGFLDLANGRGGLVIDPITGNLWVGGTANSNLIEITTDGTLVRTVDLTDQGINREASGLAFDQDGKLLVSSIHAGIYRINLDGQTESPRPHLSSVQASAFTGTPADNSLASANAGQVVEIAGMNLGPSTQVLFTTRSNLGEITSTVVSPNTVSPDGTRAQVITPGLATTADLTLLDGTGQARLQIVPTLTRIEGQPGIDAPFTLLGSGFMDGVTTVTVGGVELSDQFTNEITALFDGQVSGPLNDRYQMRLPLAVEGPIRIETEGGFSLLTGPTFNQPAFVEFVSMDAQASLGQPTNPNQSSANTGQTITLRGKNFTRETVVQFAGSDPTGVNGIISRNGTPSGDGTELEVTVPALARTGPVNVLGSETEIELQIVPTVRSIGGPLSPTQQVILEGTGLAASELTLLAGGQFVPIPQVKTIFSEGIAQQVIQFTVPDEVVGNRVQVITPGGSAIIHRDNPPTDIDNINTFENGGTGNDLIGDTLATAFAFDLPLDRRVVIGDSWINRGTDVDLYAVNLTAGDQTTFELRELTTATNYLRLFDFNGHELEDNYQSSLNQNIRYRRWSFSIPTDGVYYFGISNNGNRIYDPTITDSGDGSNAQLGSYRLIVTRSRDGSTSIKDIHSSASQGTAAIHSIPSANPGQEITLTGTDFRVDDRILFTTINDRGEVGMTTISPNEVALDGSSLKVTVPAIATTGSVRLEREFYRGLFLQVVPTLSNVYGFNNSSFNLGTVTVEGSGFAEAATGIFFGPVNWTDNSTNFSPLDVLSTPSNGKLFVQVPPAASFGPIRVVTLGGSSETFDLTFESIQASTESGTPTHANIASANPGQTITLTGTNFTNTTSVVFESIEQSGEPGQIVVLPDSVSPDGSNIQITVPTRAATGEVGIIGDSTNTRIPLQIVPLIESLDISFTNFTTGVATTLLYGKGFIEGDAVYQFGGEQVSDSEDNQGPDVLGNNQSVRLSVPTTGPVTGPITVTTAGGTSDPFSVRFDDIISVATSGTPANPSEPSANPGQVITVTGTQLTELTDFMTRFRDPSGGIRYEIIQPNFASADGTQATLLIPEKYNGAFNIRRLGADQEHLLQIVPVVESIDVTSFNGTATLTGKGFQEAAGAIYQISGINIVDDSVSQSPHVNFNNQTANLTLPMHGFGQFTLTTDGGISEPISPNFFHPALGELRDIAFDGNHVWVADTAGKIHQVDRSSGQTLSTVDLPGGTASGIGLHITPEAMTLAGITVPAGSLLVSNSRPSPDQVFAINPITGEIISTLALEQNLDVVSLTYDPSGGGHLYLLDANPSQVVEIDLGTGSVINTIDISGFLDLANGRGGLVIDPITGNLWVGGTANSNLIEITTDGTLVRTVDLTDQGINREASGLAFDQDGKLLVSSIHAGIYRINL
ncbi:MAG: Ig-like domain-containing protein [Rubripirellula sp.]